MSRRFVENLFACAFCVALSIVAMSALNAADRERADRAERRADSLDTAAYESVRHPNVVGSWHGLPDSSAWVYVGGYRWVQIILKRDGHAVAADMAMWSVEPWGTK